MALENYQDISPSAGDLNAGFQFQFNCSNCSRHWKTPFKPYRMGQVSGFLSRFSFLLGSSAFKASRATGGAADYGRRQAKEEALAEFMPQAEAMFTNCEVCGNGFCEDCVDDSRTCAGCRQKAGGGAHGYGNDGAQGAAGHACPNCGVDNKGGRFCAECGFDMASTHKSCPACGAMAERGARFCTDCGHGY
ncbi:zinc ribbon domain-containing protein [Pelomonas sp. KK5]|uniref:double zinc ribbon domain-containing protein n=1 Tax=Pelomonas sp. KK5 TaxID=1855730 RepID=UPI00097CBBD1|nr:zinc ribbon domain-containing protein [Pelomonas sp. KK5]